MEAQCYVLGRACGLLLKLRVEAEALRHA
jgi:hypothetical protein